MSEKMVKELVIHALNDTYQRAEKPSGIILHSDRGSKYYPRSYNDIQKKYNFNYCMYHKGNYWDNATMESLL